MKAVRDNTEQGGEKLFKNELLEKLTHTHIAVPISIFVLFSSGILFCAITFAKITLPLTLFLFVVGLLSFTLVEYLMHRYLYHIQSGRKSLVRLQYLIHGVHHDYPKDKSRLAMPPVLSVLIAVVLLALTYFLMGDYALAFLPGFVIGYAAYLFVHYIVHAYHPPKNSFRVLWKHHSIHHYKDANVAFGVSSPLWDYVFGTMPVN